MSVHWVTVQRWSVVLSAGVGKGLCVYFFLLLHCNSLFPHSDLSFSTLLSYPSVHFLSLFLSLSGRCHLIFYYVFWILTQLKGLAREKLCQNVFSSHVSLLRGTFSVAKVAWCIWKWTKLQKFSSFKKLVENPSHVSFPFKNSKLFVIIFCSQCPS